MMRAPSGQPITQFNMENSDYLGGLKYDFLTVKAMDKIRVTLDLLSEDGRIEWKDSLRETYDYYLYPDKLEFDNLEIWKLMHKNKVLDLFQYSTSIGIQTAQKIKPISLKQAASGNDLMRLMAERGQKQPIDKYIEFKDNIKLWDNLMIDYGLTLEERLILKEHLEATYGIATTQESIMKLAMDKRISGFNVKEANKLRKAVAKKKKKIMDEVKELFKEKGLKLGTSLNMLRYIWKECILPQAGYSFSECHTLPYTVIAVQQLNLAYNYPIVYWNTACLSVNAGSLEDSEAKKAKTTDYGSIASAIGKMKENGVILVYPDINRANFDFKPDADNNLILFGLKSMNKIGQDLVAEIIENRPYESIEDFCMKVKVNITQMISLIKGGSFDTLENKPREEIMKDYLWKACAPKKKLTMQNLNALINGGFIPEKYKIEMRVSKFNKYLRRRGNKFIINDNDYYLFDEAIKEGYYTIFDFPEAFVETIEGNLYISKKL
ncbi:MAG: DNA polymerase III subunit alpha [Candidatus Izimaplasma bacterium HR2]|nr:MAG: DNA polymerase III subunit alpha [Candidatus Izimaplasma bacterium HR2]